VVQEQMVQDPVQTPASPEPAAEPDTQPEPAAETETDSGDDKPTPDLSGGRP
jgi:hypothetical protein